MIRPATEDDFASLSQLYFDVDALHHRALPGLFRAPDAITRSVEFIKGVLANEENLMLVAEWDGELIGFIHATVHDLEHPFMVPQRVAHIHDIVVAEAFRGRGAAPAMLTQAVDWAAEQGATQIQLNVFEFNDRARAFYEKNGFLTGSRRMWKPLSSTN